jgi:hypothetical protein
MFLEDNLFLNLSNDMCYLKKNHLWWSLETWKSRGEVDRKKLDKGHHDTQESPGHLVRFSMLYIDIFTYLLSLSITSPGDYLFFLLVCFKD